MDPTFTDWLDRLTAAHDAGDAETYYTVLNERDPYGALALGVYRDNTFSGILANNYAHNKLENDLSYSYGSSFRAAVQLGLMQADFAQRQAQNTEGLGYLNLPARTISDYHDDVFATVFGAISAQAAWLPYYVVRVQDDYSIIYASSVARIATYFDIIVEQFTSDDPTTQQQAFEWLQDMRAGLVYEPSSGDWQWGDRVFLESLVESGAQLVGVSEYEADIMAFSLGLGAENPVVSAALEGAATAHFLEQAGGALFNTESGGASFDVADISDATHQQQIVELLKLGIKFDIAEGDLEEAKGDGADYGDSFELIDGFTPISVGFQTDQPYGSGSEEDSLLIGGEEATLIGLTGSDLIYSGAGASTGLGGEGEDILIGGNGANKLYGGLGADKVRDGEGADIVDGGQDDDEITLTDDNAGDTIIIGEGSDTITGGSATDRLHLRVSALSGDPDDAGSTIPLLGGLFLYPAWEYGNPIGPQITYAFDPVHYDNYEDGEISPYYPEIGMFRIEYSFEGGDLRISVLDQSNWDIQNPEYELVSETLIQNYEAGDFGLSFEEIAHPYVNDGMQEWYDRDNPVYEAEMADLTNNGQIATFETEEEIRDAAEAAQQNQMNGSSGSDSQTGTDRADRIYPGAGDDVASAGSGNDTFVAGTGAGDDSYDGGDGFDTIVFPSTSQGVQVDLATGTATGPEIGTDTLVAIEAVKGGSSADTILGDAQANRLYGSGGDDSLDGRAGADRLYGGYGDDGLAGGDGDDNLYGEAGSDTLDGGAGNDELSGGDGDDALDGGDGDDELDGGYGDDLLNDGAGADLISGGVGLDTIIVAADAANDTFDGGEDGALLDYTGAQSTISVDLELGTAISAAFGSDTLVSIYDVNGGEGADTILGSEFVNFIRGSSGDDEIDGRAENDSLYGEAGEDTILGGLGWDLVEGGDGNDNLDGGDENDEVDGGSGEDVLRGGSGYDRLRGGTGDDEILGEGDGDIMEGGEGSDQLFGGEGDDLIFGSMEEDWLDEEDNGNDLVDGGAGDDELYGNAGDDTMRGGSGADYLDGGLGVDTASYSDAATGVFVHMELIEQNTGDAEGDVYWSIENVEGSAFNDTLIATDEGNVIQSGAGADIIVGGAGADELWGGDGSDTFSFAIGFGEDAIGDFVPGQGTEDVIEFTDGLFADFAAVLAAATQDGSDVLISVTAQDTLTLRNVQLSALHQDDFLLAA